ncbi:hypothetical protein ZWY2020_010742 [Hordeum vulgare]|nr:hypothetical protein ZWY2020_010742 [Hordeum vulgare]
MASTMPPALALASMSSTTPATSSTSTVAPALDGLVDYKGGMMITFPVERKNLQFECAYSLPACPIDFLPDKPDQALPHRFSITGKATLLILAFDPLELLALSEGFFLKKSYCTWSLCTWY